MAPPTQGTTPSYQQQHPPLPPKGVKYTQLEFNEGNSPTESNVGGGVENHQILQSNAWYVIAWSKTICVRV